MVLYVAGIVSFAILSVYSWNRNMQIQDSINLGVELQKESREVKSLMKDIVFDLFTPKVYGQVRSLTYSPRSAVTLKQWQEAVLKYKKTFSDFMGLSDLVKSDDEVIRDQYFTALMMNDKAMEMLDKMESTLFILREKYRTSDNLYNEMQKNDSLNSFFREFQETSYYFTNSFESFMNYFIKTLEEEGARLRRGLTTFFIVSAVLILCVSVFLTLYIARDLSRKLLKVEQSFRQVSHGNFSVRIDISSKDEFGAFATTFTNLVTDLKENVDSILNLTRDIGAFITDGSDLTNLLDIVAQAVIQDTTADAVVIYRFDHDGAASLDLSKGAEQNEKDLEKMLGIINRRIIRPNSHFLYRSAAAQVFDDRSVLDMELVTSFLAVPLVVQGRTFGLLVSVKNSEDDPFSDLGITRLMTFAEYASLSIENFLTYNELLERREAQYQALSSQVQPHFIYNVMSGILGLNSRGDREAIRRTIEALKGMLRYIQSGNSWTSLEEEIDFIRQYLLLQKIRFGERLDFEIDIDDEIRHLQLPRLLLQPVVENAVIHGIEPLEEGGKLFIYAKAVRRRGEMRADITISDNGTGFMVENLETGANIGISNVRQRLNVVFPEGTFRIQSSPGAGTSVELKI